MISLFLSQPMSFLAPVPSVLSCGPAGIGDRGHGKGGEGDRVRKEQEAGQGFGC